MGTVTSGVGLFSGIDFTTLVNQLLAIDARPRDQLLARMRNVDAQRTAFMDISARIAALLGRVESLTRPGFFRANQASSSNPDVLAVTVGETAQPGAYSFIVRALATTHQLVSRGFASKDAAVPPGTFTLESSQARVNGQTVLEELNGFTGVQRGSFELTDGTGQKATVNIREAQTVGDVLDLINAAGIGVRAELRGEAIVLRDTSGGTQGVRIRELGDGHTAADLGFGPGHTYNAGGELLGTDILYLAGTTLLSALNDGLGVRRAVAGGDFTIQSSDPSVLVTVDLSEIIKPTTHVSRLNHGQGVELGTIRITTRDGRQTEVDLSAAQTVGDVKQAIETSVSGVSVVMAGGRLVITDTTNATKNDFVVADVQGHAARDLGIAGSTGGTKIDGRQILFVDTVADVLAAVNYGEGNQSSGGTPVIEASIDPTGQRLVITDHGSGTFPATVLGVAPGSTSKALFDLGFQPGSYGSFGAQITGQRIIGGVDTVLLKTLNGGTGITGGVIHIDANGVGADIDVSSAQTLRDAVEQINAAAAQGNLGIAAGYDTTGTRLLITNVQNEAGLISISDVTGNFAQSVGIAGSANRIRGSNLQRQYVTELTRLADLNAGHGVSLGKFRITDSKGVMGIIDLAEAQAETLQDVIDAINALGIGVEAGINATGDGLRLTDTAGGSGTLTVAEDGGTAARELNLLHDALAGTIDGSYEFKIDLSTGATLTDLLGRINGTTLATASLINDGSPAAPYRLSVLSRATGRSGELLIDAGETTLDFTTLTRAQDARVLLGSTVDGGILVSSASNTLTNIVEGLTLNLLGVDDQPVTVTVDRDLEGMLSTLNGLVTDFNSLMDRIGDLSSYDPETNTAGILFADATLQTLETRLFRAVTGAVPGATGTLTRLSQVGVKFGDGLKLSFDEEKFRQVYQDDPEAVTRFFTAAETGVAVQLKEGLERLTQTGGLIPRRDLALQDQKDLMADRVEKLNALLARKRERLLREFWNMEQVLGQLQSQQTALSSLSAMAQSLSSWFAGGSRTGGA